MLVGVGGFLAVAGLGQQNLELFVPHVAEAFVEEQAEYVLLVVPGIDGPPQDVRRLPEMPFEFRLRKLSH